MRTDITERSGGEVGTSDREWITAEEAARLLSEQSGHPVGRQYVRKLVQWGYVTARPIDGRTYLYNRHEVEAYRVRSSPGRRSSSTPPSTPS